MPGPGPGALHGKRVLVVEGGPMMATNFAGRLRDNRVEVVGPVASVQDALALIAAGAALDAALIDVALNDGRADPIADALRERGVPVVFVSSDDP